MNGLKRLGLLACTLVLAGFAGACDSDSTGPEEITGSYQVVSVAGQSIPVTLIEQEEPGVGTIGVVLSAGTLTLSADQSYSLMLTAQGTVNGDVVSENTEPQSGTFEVSGSTITFTDPEAGEVTGTIAGSEITVTETIEDAGTIDLVFRK